MKAPRKLTAVGTIGRASLSTPRARAGAHAVRRVSLRPVLDVRAAPTLLHRHTQGGMEHIVRPRRRRAEIRPRYARVPRLTLFSPRSIVAGELLKFAIALGVISLRADSTAAPAGSLSDRLKWLMEHSAKMAVRRAGPNTRSPTRSSGRSLCHLCLPPSRHDLGAGARRDLPLHERARLRLPQPHRRGHLRGDTADEDLLHRLLPAHLPRARTLAGPSTPAWPSTARGQGWPAASDHAHAPPPHSPSGALWSRSSSLSSSSRSRRGATRASHPRTRSASRPTT